MSQKYFLLTKKTLAKDFLTSIDPKVLLSICGPLKPGQYQLYFHKLRMENLVNLHVTEQVTLARCQVFSAPRVFYRQCSRI